MYIHGGVGIDGELLDDFVSINKSSLGVVPLSITGDTPSPR